MNKSFCLWGNSMLSIADEISKNFDEPPVVLCLGTTRILEDCLGAMVGSILKKNNYKGFVYGTLDAPISVFNLKYCLDFLKATHKNKKLLIVDASTTKEPSRIGNIVLAKDYKPFNKILVNQKIEADWFLFGVCSVNAPTFPTLLPAKLGIVRKLAKTIAKAILKTQYQQNKQNYAF